MTDSYALFGFPVHHSWSPFIHGLFARQTGQDMAYRLHESPPEHFRHEVLDFFFKDGGNGANVTVPHKRAAADLVNELTPRAQLADAVNTILRRDGELIGDNTDGVGLVTDLTRNLRLRFTSPRILLLGAGGAARGALGPLLELKPSTLVIANRTAERAIELAREFADYGEVSGAAFDSVEPLEPFDLIVNATSASLKGEVPPIPVRAVDRTQPATTWRTASVKRRSRNGPVTVAAIAWHRAGACWSNKRPKHSTSGAACVRQRRRCSKRCAPALRRWRRLRVLVLEQHVITRHPGIRAISSALNSRDRRAGLPTYR